MIVAASFQGNDVHALTNTTVGVIGAGNQPVSWKRDPDLKRIPSSEVAVYQEIIRCGMAAE